ncbi:MAG: anaerobic ribonucleoside-triphosphate reductase activating protein [Ruminococcaceae bacterium]|nr:anaerobic ribonucleoside-triphosphate reductase activating protein [Oscillospiraceae bacterium]
MVFHGFQKLTLLDFPGKVAATLFTAGCNFRCPFCHNASLVTHIENSETYTEDEVLNVLKKRQGVLDGVCLTGGEPLLQNGVGEFLSRVKALGYAVKLDTNGSFPDKLKSLVESGIVDYVAMDIKNAKEKYAATAACERFSLAAIEESVDFLMKSGVDYEFRTTVVKGLHEIQDIEKIGLWIQGAEKYFLQNFVDSGDLIGTGMAAFSVEEMQKMQKIAALYVKNAAIRGI